MRGIEREPRGNRERKDRVRENREREDRVVKISIFIQNFDLIQLF